MAQVPGPVWAPVVSDKGPTAISVSGAAARRRGTLARPPTRDCRCIRQEVSSLTRGAEGSRRTLASEGDLVFWFAQKGYPLGAVRHGRDHRRQVKGVAEERPGLGHAPARARYSRRSGKMYSSAQPGRFGRSRPTKSRLASAGGDRGGARHHCQSAGCAPGRAGSCVCGGMRKSPSESHGVIAGVDRTHAQIENVLPLRR